MKLKQKPPQTYPVTEASQPSCTEPTAHRKEQLLRKLEASGDWMEPPCAPVQVQVEPKDVDRIRDALTVGEGLDQATAEKLPMLLRVHRTLGQAIRQLAAADRTNTAALTALIENSVADMRTLEGIRLDRLRTFSREMPVFPHLLRIRASGGSIPKNRVSDLQLGESVKYARELSNTKRDRFTTKAHDYLWALHDHCHKEITLDLWDSIAIILRWYADNDPDLPALTEKIRTSCDEGSEPRNRARAKETIVERAGSLLGRHKSSAIRSMHVKKPASRN